MTPEEIANRGFASAFRGLSETEVRNYLKRVADDMAAARDREADLTAQVGELRAELRNPAPLTEQQLLDSLGEETARVLRSAQEAAEDIRSRAEERAGTLVREAQEEAGRRREEAETAARERTDSAERLATEREETAAAEAARLKETAEQGAAEMLAAAERDAQEARATAAAAAESEIEAAKETGRGLVNEARTVRERVLADLGRRRTLLQAQVDELRAGRDRLLDGYRVVKRTLSEATDALAGVEARAATALAGAPEPVEVPAVEGELETLAGEQQPSATPTGEVEALVVVEGADDGSGAAVDALFARLKAEAGESQPEPVPGPATAPEVAPPPPAGPQPAPVVVAAEPGAPAEDSAAATEPPEAPGENPTEAPVSEAQASGELSGDDAVRAERAAVLEPLAKDVARRLKRSLQDEQNDLLDRIRKVKGAPKALDVLASEADQHRAWSEALRAPLTTAYAGGYALGGGGKTPKLVPGPLLDELAADLVVRLRDRLVVAIDDAPDVESVTQRLGARYREFKAQELDGAVGDALAAAWAKGTFDATPAGTSLRWVPEVVGQCPDCDDNALEPTIRGEQFPTGTPHPPAHPGCRCLLVPDTA